MNTVNFDAIVRQFAATSGDRRFSVRLSLTNGDTIAGKIGPHEPSHQGLPKLISLRSACGETESVEIADIVRVSGPFLVASDIALANREPRFEALQSARCGYWYVDERTEEGGITVVGGHDMPLTEKVAHGVADALNNAVAALQEGA